MSEASYVVCGAAGQLGQELLQRLPAAETQGLTRAQLDLARPETVAAVLSDLRPRVVFNCAAYNLVDQAEEEPEQAFAVNALGPLALARACQALGAVLVHFSTDYVFGLEGFRPAPYRESDAPGPVSVYGASKLAGEHLVRQACEQHFIIRSSGLYGRPGVAGAGGKGGNFVLTMLRLGRAGQPLRVVADQMLTPTSVADLAEGTLRLIQESAFGLYHLTNAGQCSWHEFAAAIFERAGLQVELAQCPSSERNDRARRPEYSVLATEHQGVPRLRPWREALAEYLALVAPTA